MNIDTVLAKLPVIGFVFKRSYAFWRSNIAVANVTHIIFGIGLALVFFTNFFTVGIILILLVAVMHLIALIVGSN